MICTKVCTICLPSNLLAIRGPNVISKYDSGKEPNLSISRHHSYLPGHQKVALVACLVLPRTTARAGSELMTWTRLGVPLDSYPRLAYSSGSGRQERMIPPQHAAYLECSEDRLCSLLLARSPAPGRPYKLIRALQN